MFKLNRLSAEGGIEMDEAGLHHLVFARRHTDNSSAEYDSAALRANEVGYALADPRLIEDWVEFATEPQHRRGAPDGAARPLRIRAVLDLSRLYRR
jgi:hypothetical protein